MSMVYVYHDVGSRCNTMVHVYYHGSIPWYTCTYHGTRVPWYVYVYKLSQKRLEIQARRCPGYVHVYYVRTYVRTYYTCTWILDVGVVCPGTQRYVDQGSCTTPGLAAEAYAAVKVAKYADQDNSSRLSWRQVVASTKQPGTGLML